jgi:phenylacetate-CoA ligase
MILLEFLRRTLFWVLDFFKGGRVRKHYRDVKFIQENSHEPKAEIRKKYHLKRILEHAKITVPFYQEKVNCILLQDFPVINKTFVRENFESLKSETFIKKHNHRIYTSGSTGNPFEILHDKNKRIRNTADTIYFGNKGGFKFGSRLYYLRLWDKQYKKSNILSWIQNISMHSVDELTEADIDKLIQNLEKDTSTKSILSYTSALQVLCNYLDQKGYNPGKIKVNSVIAIAESLNDYVRTSIKKHFNVKVVSRYSNSENGILAQQSIQSDTDNFQINWSSYYMEILDLNHDIPVKNGVLGRIVVTDLFNYCMPLIRYDTGDVGVMDVDPENQNGPLVFKMIEGRKMDMFTNTKGEYLSSHIIHKILQYGEIEQFQFIEEDDFEYIIKLKVLKNFDYSNEQKMMGEYQDYFGEEAVVKIEYVDNIPLLPSGKRKLVINNAKKNIDNLLYKSKV